jgi:hypothetical protein
VAIEQHQQGLLGGHDLFQGEDENVVVAAAPAVVVPDYSFGSG